MPAMYRGARQSFTVRLNTTLAGRVIAAARQRRWSVSDYIAWCIEEQMVREPVGAGR